jgi:hypothetical protein
VGIARIGDAVVIVVGIAGVAGAVGVDIELFGIGSERATVEGIRYRIAVGIGGERGVDAGAVARGAEAVGGREALLQHDAGQAPEGVVAVADRRVGGGEGGGYAAEPRAEVGQPQVPVTLCCRPCGHP